MPLDRQWIEQHIPHKGRMCLLDEVLSWDATRIRCRSATHRSADNPLRLHGRLGIACGIEYAAQAMAVHGALRAASLSLENPGGLLASGRGLTMNVDRLADIGGSLLARGAPVPGDRTIGVYQFSLAYAARR